MEHVEIILLIKFLSMLTILILIGAALVDYHYKQKRSLKNLIETIENKNSK